MGTWGVKLYDSDSASDARDEWLTALRLGASADEATGELLERWGTDDDPLTWLALADTQWTWGRLDARVLERAQRALAAGGDLALWEDAKDRAARRRIFDRLAARLKQPPPAPKAIRVQGDDVAWKRGQLWAYHTLDDKHVVFRVAACDPTCGRVGAPVTELLDVVLDALTPAVSLADAGARSARPDYNASGRYDFFPPEHRASPLFQPMVKKRGDLPRHRLKRLHAQGEPRAATAETPTVGVPWDGLDDFLSLTFDVGGPRPGAVHAWSLPSGDTAYTMVQFGHWEATLVRPMWQLAVLDCRGAGADANTIEKAAVADIVSVEGFAPPGLREIGYRPIQSAEQAYALIGPWDELPDWLEQQPYRPADMNIAEGNAIVKEYLERFLSRSHADLVANLGVMGVETITGPSGASYVVQVNIKMHPGYVGDVCVTVDLDDARAEETFLLGGGFIKTPKGKLR